MAGAGCDVAIKAPWRSGDLQRSARPGFAPGGSGAGGQPGRCRRGRRLRGDRHGPFHLRLPGPGGTRGSDRGLAECSEGVSVFQDRAAVGRATPYIWLLAHVARALMPAGSRLVSTLFVPSGPKSVEMSLDAADTSICATVSPAKLFLRDPSSSL